MRGIETACARHGVSLQAAALQFPLAHPAVASVVSGAKRPGQVADNVRALAEAIPATFWAELRAEGLIDRNAPVPG